MKRFTTIQARKSQGNVRVLATRPVLQRAIARLSIIQIGHLVGEVPGCGRRCHGDHIADVSNMVGARDTSRWAVDLSAGVFSCG